MSDNRMNRREVFDRVKTHLLAQNKRATNGDTCLYIDNEGNRCAVGCLIPPEVGAGLNGTIYTPVVRRAVERALSVRLNRDDLEFLYLLQRVHDLIVPEDWKGALADIENELDADEHRLLELREILKNRYRLAE